MARLVCLVSKLVQIQDQWILLASSVNTTQSATLRFLLVVSLYRRLQSMLHRIGYNIPLFTTAFVLLSGINMTAAQKGPKDFQVITTTKAWILHGKWDAYISCNAKPNDIYHRLNLLLPNAQVR